MWFDSGVSFAAVIEREGLAQPSGPPVDLYLEGSDQHRGWFHSSLLTSLATRERPPYREVLTHGFVVDGAGKKISKSKGNFTDPFKAIGESGAELLRLWVASEDYREDIRISQEILTRLTDTYRKLRNTLRFMLGNLSDFHPAQDLVPASDLVELDCYALSFALAQLDRMHRAYEEYELHVVLSAANELCTVQLSAFYLDVLKDRLYASPKESRERRSAQTAIYVISRHLLRMLAPILCFTAEEAYGSLPRMPKDPSSIHQALLPGVDDPAPLAALCESVRAQGLTLTERYELGLALRRNVNALLEEDRRQKRLGSSVEAAVTIRGPAELMEKLSSFGERALADIFIVSEVTLGEVEGELAITTARATGTKCPRCWLYRHDAGTNPAHPELCARCAEAI